ncbi:hypothetical protein CFM96_03505, partial [Klebsiella michiganensis]|nr:hypothetical protein [Klebsiella michiganensis]
FGLAENTDDLFVGKTLLHGDVLMWLMKTLLTSRCINQRGAGHLIEKRLNVLKKFSKVIFTFSLLNSPACSTIGRQKDHTLSGYWCTFRSVSEALAEPDL